MVSKEKSCILKGNNCSICGIELPQLQIDVSTPRSQLWGGGQLETHLGDKWHLSVISLVKHHAESCLDWAGPLALSFFWQIGGIFRVAPQWIFENATNMFPSSGVWSSGVY